MFFKIKNICENKIFNNAVMIISILVFAIFSLYKALNHIPFFDEINAWNISAYLKPSEIFEITRYEGHMFIWYFLIKPFAQNGIGFPTAMQLINWIFVIGSIIILWWKAPFNNIVKILITFSMPFRIFYLHARCYSIGIFLLFSLCALYKNRLKHPYLYATLLILAANTSIMAAIIAFCLGLCFLYDLYKSFNEKTLNKKEIITSISICLFGALVVILQLYKFSTPFYALTFSERLHIHPLYAFFLGSEVSINIIRIILIACFWGLITFSWNFFEKNKLPFTFMLSSNILYLILFSYFYEGEFWHFIYLFIVIIIAIWIYLSEYKITQSFQKTYMYLFYTMFFILTFCFGTYCHEGRYIPLVKYIQTNGTMFENKKIFFYPADMHLNGIVPVIKDKNISYYDCHGNSIKSVEFYKHLWDNPTVDFDKISSILKKGETAYVIIDENNDNNKYMTETILYTRTHKNSDLKIEYYKNAGDYAYIWKISKHK